MSYHVGSKNIPDADPKVENPGTVNSDSLAAESVNKSGDFAEGSDDRGPNAGAFSSSSGGQKQDGSHHGDVFQPAAVGEDVVLDGEGQSSSTSNNNSNSNSNSSGSYGSQSNSRSQGGNSDYQSGNSSSRNNDSSGTTAERAGLVSDDNGDLASTRREENDGSEQTGDVFDPAATGTTVVHDPSTDSTSSSGQGQQGSVTATQSSGRDTRSSNDTTYSSTNVTGGQTSAFSGSNSSSGQQPSGSTGLNRSDSGAGATGVTSAIGKGDAFDRPNASWTTDIGGKRDPGRVALEQMEASNAESNEGRERDLKIDDNNQFSDLGGVTQS